MFEDAVHGKNGGRVEYVGPVMMQSVNFTLQNTGNGVMVFHETEAVGDIPQKNIQNEDVVRVAYEGGRCSVSVEAEKEMDKAVGLER